MTARGFKVGKHAAIRYVPVSTIVQEIRGAAAHCASTVASLLKKPTNRIMEVINPLAYLSAFRRTEVSGTYRPPSAKVIVNPTFMFLDDCNFHTAGSGMMIIARSVMMFIKLDHLRKSAILKQVPPPGTLWFQKKASGRQICVMATVVPIQFPIMSEATILVKMRYGLVENTRT